jgi:hypothetical protein
MAQSAQLTVIEFTKQQFLFYFYARRVFRLWPIKPQRGKISIFFFLRHHARTPPLANIRPGRPAPAMGPRTAATLVIRLVTGDIICCDFCNLTCGIGAEHGASLPGSRYNFFGDGDCFNACRNSSRILYESVSATVCHKGTGAWAI